MKPPRPRLPTTISEASRDSARRASAGAPAVSHTGLDSFATTGNDASRADPARCSRNFPQVPADPRKATGGNPCYGGKSPPIPAQPGTATTGLSRRRSRVRVPSLPLNTCKSACS
jgi:hypothetical protein